MSVHYLLKLAVNQTIDLSLQAQMYSFRSLLVLFIANFRLKSIHDLALLGWAVFLDDFYVAKMLVEAGAKIDEKYDGRMSVKEIAEKYKRPKSEQYFLDF